MNGELVELAHRHLSAALVDATISSQLPPPSRESSILTLGTPHELQVIFCDVPTSQLSPPSGTRTVIDGTTSVRSTAQGEPAKAVSIA